MTKEYKHVTNYYKCSNILIEQIGDIDPQIEEEITNLDQTILPHSKERLGTFHEILHESIDFPIIQEGVSGDHIMLESSDSLFENEHTDPKQISYNMFEISSPNHSKIDEVRKEESLENFIGNNYSSSRDPFHFLVSNSFYSIHPNLFLDFDVHKTLSTLSNDVPLKFDFFHMLIVGDLTIKHKTNELGFVTPLMFFSFQSFIREEGRLQDIYIRPIFYKINAPILVEVEDSFTHKKHLFLNYVDDNQIFDNLISITFDHHKFISILFDSSIILVL
jgi:hypothetical protein